jgi:sulfite exporter TauE/SafE
MINILLAFVTGLTTGGLSCLAVQGGLLASSLANQIEQDVQAQGKGTGRKKKKNTAAQPRPKNTRFAWPILAFLAAKLVAYTILGFILGLVGSMFQLTPVARAIFQIAIGIFMVGSALRMLNVHPIFRYFVIEPPAFIRRRLRKTAAGSSSIAAPAFLGFMTVLIPCGITQAMMAAALAAGRPLEGAALMFAFTLGASPVFFAVAYFATQLGAKLEKNFMRFAAVVVLLLGLFSVDSGLSLAGSPVSLTRQINQWFSRNEEPAASPPDTELQVFNPALNGPDEPVPGETSSADGDAEDVITIQVHNTSYEPSVVRAKAGVPLKLRLVTKDVYSCSLAFVIPSLNIQKNLVSTGEAWIDIPPQEKGARIPFSCSMGMFTGDIFFE